MKKPERKQLGVHIRMDLWRQFKSRAVAQGVSAGALLEQLMEIYLNKQERR